jgi:DNA-directed RNA polymerase alpha subunit
MRVESVGLSEGAAQALRDAGYASVASLRKAPDEELLAVPGIGAATLQQIRALVGE